MIRRNIFHFTKLDKTLLIFLFLLYGFFFNEHPGYNVNTRIDLTHSIVDLGKINIDAYWNNHTYKEEYYTHDVAYYQGHFYCDKSPVTSLLGVPVYWFFATLCDLVSINLPPDIARYLVTLFVISLPSALLSVLLYRFLGLIYPDPRSQLMIVLFYALGTIVFPYSFLFLSHQIVIVLIFGGFYYLYSWLQQDIHKQNEESRSLLLLSGFFVGLGFAAEQTTGIMLLGITLFLFYHLRKKTQIAWFLLGIGATFIIPMYYNYVCFGNPFTLGYKYEAMQYFQENMSRGFMGITYPHWQALWGITFSPYRGLFFFCPVLLFALPGFYFLCRDKQMRSVGFLCLFIVFGFFLFNSSYYAWDGGWAAGPRHLIPMIPFLMIPLYSMMRRLKWIIIFAGILSILSLSLICMTEPQLPEEFTFPLTQYTIPMFVHFDFTQNILTAFLHIPRPCAVLIWALFVIIGIVFLLRFSASDSPRTDLVDR